MLKGYEVIISYLIGRSKPINKPVGTSFKELIRVCCRNRAAAQIDIYGRCFTDDEIDKVFNDVKHLTGTAITDESIGFVIDKLKYAEQNYLQVEVDRMILEYGR